MFFVLKMKKSLKFSIIVPLWSLKDLAPTKWARDVTFRWPFALVIGWFGRHTWLLYLFNEYSFLIRLIIEYVEDKNNEMESWSGYVLALAMFVVAMIQTICLQNNFYLTFTAGMRIRTAIIGAVYRKVGTKHAFSWRQRGKIL